MIQLYAIDLNNYKEIGGYTRFFSLLDEKRLLRIHSFDFEKDRLVCSLAGLLLHYISRNCYKMSELETILVYNSQGKPQFKNSPFHFSISHSGNWLLCAWSNQLVGIDVEKVEVIPDYLDIAKQFFHPCEYENLKQKNPAKQLQDFYKLWTAKESYVKYSGEGLSCPLSSFFIDEDSYGFFLSERPLPRFYSGWLDSEHPYTVYSDEQIENDSFVFLSESAFSSGLEEHLKQ
ncbi:4'-phosphopantetheinyl transferase family protein [Enterococcus larvae]|uniref:4'-phosphopantetheinyl transferase family protein n=1 Tax=Enterococcus larvae TaxID=2794352 RepID=UPI003F366CCE